MTKRELYCQEIERLLEVRYATQTQAYIRNVQIPVTGIVVHSIGVAQPSVDVMHSRMNAEGDRWAVHALMNNERILLTLPWNTRSWGCGSGSKGSYNSSRFQFEICEPAGHTYNGGTMVGYDAEKNAAWFGQMYTLLTKWLVFLSVRFGLSVGQICDHAEAHQAGYASNHSDVGHWLPRHGKSMDQLRAEVTAILNEKEDDNTMAYTRILKPADVARIKPVMGLNNRPESIGSVQARTGAHIVLNGGTYGMTSPWPVDSSLTIDGTVYADRYTGFGFAFNGNQYAWSYKNSQRWPDFIGAYSTLIRNGEKSISLPLNTKDGRTSIGMTAAGELVLYVVGKNGSAACTTAELADRMAAFNCRHAINLDGSFSSQVLAPDGRVTSTRDVLWYICIWLTAATAPQLIPPSESYQARATATMGVMDSTGRTESGRRIDRGDICTISSQITENLLIQVEYPISSGRRTACVRSLEGFQKI